MHDVVLSSRTRIFKQSLRNQNATTHNWKFSHGELNNIIAYPSKTTLQHQLAPMFPTTRTLTIPNRSLIPFMQCDVALVFHFTRVWQRMSKIWFARPWSHIWEGLYEQSCRGPASKHLSCYLASCHTHACDIFNTPLYYEFRTCMDAHMWGCANGHLDH